MAFLGQNSGKKYDNIGIEIKLIPKTTTSPNTFKLLTIKLYLGTKSTVKFASN